MVVACEGWRRMGAVVPFNGGLGKAGGWEGLWNRHPPYTMPQQALDEAAERNGILAFGDIQIIHKTDGSLGRAVF